MNTRCPTKFCCVGHHTKAHFDGPFSQEGLTVVGSSYSGRFGIACIKIVGKGAARGPMKSSVVKRSIVIDGHKTSVSLEDAFWNDLKNIACRARDAVGIGRQD